MSPWCKLIDVPACSWNIYGAFFIGISQLLLTYASTNLIALGISFGGLLYGALDTTFVLILAKFFGLQVLGFNYGLLMVAQGLGGEVAGILPGRLSSTNCSAAVVMNIFAGDRLHRPTCVAGTDCFRSAFLLLSSASLVGLAVAVALWRLRQKKGKLNRRVRCLRWLGECEA